MKIGKTQFALAMGLLIFICANIAWSAQGAPATTQAAPSRIDLPSFGISVPVPDGFVRSTDDPSSIVWFVPANGSADKPDRLLWVDVFPASDTPLATIAADLARQRRLIRGRMDVKWGGREAIEYSVSDKSATLRQLLLAKDGYIYRLRCATFSSYKGTADVYESFIESTRWSTIEHPGKGVASRSPALRLPNGMGISIPDPFRPSAKLGTKSVSSFVAQDLLTKNRGARIMIIAMPKDGGPYALDAIKKDVQSNLVGSLGLDEPFHWAEAPVDGKDPIGIAESPHLRTKDGGWVQVLVARVDEGLATIIAIEVQGEKEDREGMERVIPLLKQSIREGATIKTVPTLKGQ